MPHDPVRIRVVLDPNPIDREPSNNSKECLFGAPAPLNVVCEPFRVDEASPDLSVSLTWTNTAVYDEVMIYRDGSMLASLPGSSSVFVDSYPPDGEVEYEVRGRMGASKSKRTAISCCIGCSEKPQFVRGDADGNRQLQLTDAVRILNVLFLGTGTIACDDAADADDNGQIQLTDAVRILNVLFLGTGTIPAPGPTDCGVDPTLDDKGCENYSC